MLQKERVVSGVNTHTHTHTDLQNSKQWRQLFRKLREKLTWT